MGKETKGSPFTNPSLRSNYTKHPPQHEKRGSEDKTIAKKETFQTLSGSLQIHRTFKAKEPKMKKIGVRGRKKRKPA